MEETQLLEFGISPSSEDHQDADDVKVGSLDVTYADGRRETHPLYSGQNFVGRRSAQSQKDEDKLQGWKREHPGVLHGIFLESASVSSPHAIIYVEGMGTFCFVKDMSSKNKTLMEGSTGSVVLQPGDRYAVNSGAAIKFGNIGCTITYAAQPMGTTLTAAPRQAVTPLQEETQAYDALEAGVEEIEGVQQASSGPPQSAQAAVAAPDNVPAPASAQVPLCDVTQIEMGTPEAASRHAANASTPLQSPQTLHFGHTPSGAAGAARGAAQGSQLVQQRHIGVSLEYDDGDSVWCPQLTGGPSHQLRVSQQEIMSPPKEDPGNTPVQGFVLPDEAPPTAFEPELLAEPTLAEGLPAADLLKSQHGDSRNLGQPAHAVPTHTEVQGTAYPGSLESMLAAEEDDEEPLPASGHRRSAHVLDDTLDPSERQDDEQQAAGRPADSVEAPTSFQLQLQLGTEAYQATEIHTGNGEAIPAPASVQHADVARGALPNTLQQLGLDSPALHGQAVGQGEAGEPEQAAPVTAEVMRPSTQEPDQAASVWTPLSPDDGWRPKKKRKSTGNSPSPKPEGLQPHIAEAEMLSRESTPAAVGVEGQVAKVPQHGARREYVHEDPKEAPEELSGGSWRVKHHSQAQSDHAHPVSPQQPAKPVSEADTKPVVEQPDEDSEIQGKPAEKPPNEDSESHAPSAEQQPDQAQTIPAEWQPDQTRALASARQQPDQATASAQQQPALALETQAVTSGQMFAALANVGDFADMYPNSQTQPAKQVPAYAPLSALPEETPLEDHTAAEPQGEEHSAATDLPAQAKGKGKAAMGSGAGRAKSGKANAAAARTEAGAKTAAAAPAKQPGKQHTSAPAAAKQAQHSEWSFPGDTQLEDMPAPGTARAAPRAGRLGAAFAAVKEPDQAVADPPESKKGSKRKKNEPRKAAARKRSKGKAAEAAVPREGERKAAGNPLEAELDGNALRPDEAPERNPQKSNRRGRKSAKTDQPVADVQAGEVHVDASKSVAARPVRGRKEAAAADAAAAKLELLADAPEPNEDAGGSSLQEEGKPADPPQSKPARPARGRMKSAAAETTTAKVDDTSAALEPASDYQEQKAPVDPPRSTSAKPVKGRKTAAATKQQALAVRGVVDPNQEGNGPVNSPKDTSTRATRGKRTAPAAEITAGTHEAKPDAAGETEATQAKHRLSRSTKAAQRGVKVPDQDAGSASTAQQAKRGKAKVAVAAPEKDEKEAASEQTDTSAKRFALLTESQAAAETLAKLAKPTRVKRFPAIVEDEETSSYEGSKQKQAAPAKHARRLKRASSAEIPEEEGSEEAAKGQQLPVKRARRGVHMDTLQETAAAEPEQEQQLRSKRGRKTSRVSTPHIEAAIKPEQERQLASKRNKRASRAGMLLETVVAEPQQEQQPASKRGNQASRAATPQVEMAGPVQEQQPAGRWGKRARRSGTPQDSPAESEEAAAPPAKRGKHAHSSEPAKTVPEQAKPRAARAGKHDAAKQDSEPFIETGAEPGQPSAGGRRRSRLAKSSVIPTPDRQLRTTPNRPTVVLISTCVDTQLRKSMTKTIERLGGSVTASVKDFTVFVTLDAARGQSERGFIKSLNTLSALASGAPIVSEKWVDGSGRSGTFLDARDHLLQDAAAETKFGFNLAHAWEAAQQGLLLDNTAVFLSPGLFAAESDKGEGLRMLISRAGGTVAKALTQLDSSGASQAVILGNEKDVHKEKVWAKKSCKGTFPVIGRSDFVNALLQQRLESDSCALFIT